jgi:hypothetical protein
MPRRRLLITFVPVLMGFALGMSAMSGCDPSAGEVGSIPKLKKTRAEYEAEQAPRPSKKSKGAVPNPDMK